jgi:hypothetical protein
MIDYFKNSQTVHFINFLQEVYLLFFLSNFFEDLYYINLN